MTDNNTKTVSSKDDFLRRINEIKTTRWIRFGIVAAIFLAWVAWLGNWWVSLFIFLLFDVYITGYIPFSWWKKSKNKAVKSVMSWVDAIVYALILVYFVFSFVGQNYQIPSSSLEKTLLTGDYLWVNKMAYGPRVPMTPIHFPLVQNTFPIINTKSYLDSPQWEYHRLKGFGEVESGDIVVFNFPAGDTVALKVQNPDYYTLVKQFGRDAVHYNKDTFGDIIYRPVDRRENYVKRAVGLPGETLEIKDGEISINGKVQKQPENVQFNYFFQMKNGRNLSEEEWEELGISIEDRHVSYNNPSIFYAPLTPRMTDMLRSNADIALLERYRPEADEYLYPFDKSLEWNWSMDNYGPIWIPEKGSTIELNDSTWSLYGRCIRNYEFNDAELRGNTVYINGEPRKDYTFKMDYYFMMGDNRHNSLDSRFWGFVPEDHVVGKPMFVLISFDKDKSLFNGGVRWNRIFKDANPDK
ncbi:MAG: signal peptidase I [Muribaculaceae bacterium]|nr:signal peptidase I [Muribaculaceae bacterium]